MSRELDRLLEDKHRLEMEAYELRQRVVALTQERELLAIEKARLNNDAASVRMQIDEAVAAERLKVKSLERDVASLKGQGGGEDVQRIMAERDTLRRQLELVDNTSRQQVNKLELSANALTTRVTSLQKELTTKDMELQNALKEAAYLRENMERVVKELVERNKRTEEEARRRAQDTEHELQEVLAEHQKHMSDHLACRKQLATMKEDFKALEAQVSNGKAINQQLLEERAVLEQRVAALEQSLNEAAKESDMQRAAEADTRGDLETAVAKLEKADEHIKRLSDESASANVMLIRLRHQVEQSEEDTAAAKRDREELFIRSQQATVATSEEAYKVLVDANGLVEDVKALVMGVRDKAPDAQQGDIIPASVLCKPEDIRDTTTLVAALLHLRDAFALLREDVTLVNRAVVEETQRKGDTQRKLTAGEGALRTEREHVMELSARISEFEMQLQTEQSRRREMEKALYETSQWMAEAAALGDERTKRVEQLLSDKLAKEKEVEQMQEALRGQDTKLKLLTQENAALHKALDDAETEAREGRRQHEIAVQESQRHENAATKAQGDLQASREALARSKEETIEVRQEMTKLEVEVRQLRHQLNELRDRGSDKERHAEYVDATNSKLREELQRTKRQLDNVLRREVSISSAERENLCYTSGSITMTASQLAGGSGGTATRTSPLRKVLMSSPQPPKPQSLSREYASTPMGAAASAPIPQPQVLSLPPQPQDKVKAWEERINALLQSRGAPPRQPEK